MRLQFRAVRSQLATWCSAGVQAAALLLLGCWVAAGQEARQGRKIPDLSGIQQGCQTTGFQTRERQVCEDVVERVCSVSRVM